jgi:hypothetical protein
MVRRVDDLTIGSGLTPTGDAARIRQGQLRRPIALVVAMLAALKVCGVLAFSTREQSRRDVLSGNLTLLYDVAAPPTLGVIRLLTRR